ncbi:hypothetical protein HGRIS_000919 [Hohenbuehelia grisea]|uniref:Uncharacterized protein n=1 Tax=Hohenbuehelia grisea TaxID=104357 RepID=A0ABR3IQ65_9AGAR
MVGGPPVFPPLAAAPLDIVQGSRATQNITATSGTPSSARMSSGESSTTRPHSRAARATPSFSMPQSYDSSSLQFALSVQASSQSMPYSDGRTSIANSSRPSSEHTYQHHSSPSFDFLRGPVGHPTPGNFIHGSHADDTASGNDASPPLQHLAAPQHPQYLRPSGAPVFAPTTHYQHASPSNRFDSASIASYSQSLGINHQVEHHTIHGQGFSPSTHATIAPFPSYSVHHFQESQPSSNGVVAPAPQYQYGRATDAVWPGIQSQAWPRASVPHSHRDTATTALGPPPPLQYEPTPEPHDEMRMPIWLSSNSAPLNLATGLDGPSYVDPNALGMAGAWPSSSSLAHALDDERLHR